MTLSIRHWHKYLNAVRWLSLSIVFFSLILIPFLYLYQTYEARHAYDQLTTYEKSVHTAMQSLSAPFVNDPVKDLNLIKGSTWTGIFLGLAISDPLAVVSTLSAEKTIFWPFLLSALIPIIVTMLLGRIFCGWICPATFLYELNDKLRAGLKRLGLIPGNKRFDFNIKYYVLLAGIILSAVFGTATLFAIIYPPAIIGRELNYAIALGGIGSGVLFLLMTLFFDLLISRRSFCRYFCPGGALYSLLGRFRLLRIQRKVEACDDCADCINACQFGLNPLHDNFGQECNNCTACISACKPDALGFTIAINDKEYQGIGHRSKHWIKHNPDTVVPDNHSEQRQGNKQ